MANKEFTGISLFLLYVAIGLGTFIQILDTSIANVAIPYIAGNLSVSADEGTWVITSFAASNAIVLPLTGWLSNYFGRVRLFIGSLILFAITSFLCGFSTSLTMLVFFRILQGGVAGCLIPLSQSLLATNVAPEKQGAALGIWGMIVIVAPVLGPIVGGYITQEWSWPWIFFINVPLGFLSAFLTWALLKDRESPIQKLPIDWVGLILLSLGVATLQILLDKGHDLDWFDSNVILSLGVVSFLGFSFFAIWNYFAAYPIVDFTFFRDRNFSIATLMITLGFLLYFAATVIMPLWLQTVQNYTPFWAGLAIAPVGVIPVLFSALIGKNLWRFDLRIIVALSFFAFALSFFYQARFTTDVDVNTIMFARFLQGAGLAIFFIPIIQIALMNIPEEKYPSATGLFHFIRILIGSGFATSLTIELWDRRETFYYNRLGESLTSYSPEVHRFAHELMQDPVSSNPDLYSSLLDLTTSQQAFMLSTNDLSYLAAWLFIAMIPLPFFCKISSRKSTMIQGAAE